MSEHIFISYAHHDQAYVRSLVTWMHEAGLTTWCFEENEPHAGGMFTEMLISAITEARAVLVILSRHSANSRAVTQEVLFAGERRKPIITLFLEECEGPVRFLLSPDNWINTRQCGNPVPRIEAALATTRSYALPMAYLVVAEGYESLVSASFIALETVQYQQVSTDSPPTERTLCTIGTLPSNNLVVSPRSGLISRSHAHITLQPPEGGPLSFQIYDTSRNGTFINGRRIAGSQALNHQDYIGLAGKTVVLQFLRHGETETASRLLGHEPLTR